MSSINRILSLDIMRGITIVLMILTSYPGKYGFAYQQLELSFGCGWSLADMVVPTFLWLIGISINISFSRRRLNGSTDIELLTHTVYRGVLLFIIGVFLNRLNCIDMEAPVECLLGVSFFGVFERIGLAYLIAAPIVIIFRTCGQIIALVTILTSYQFIYLGSIQSQICEESYRGLADFTTTFPGACFILSGTVIHRYVSASISTSNFNMRRIRIISLGLMLITFSVLPFFAIDYQRLNISFFFLSCWIMTCLFVAIDYLTKIVKPTVLVVPLTVLGSNPLVVYIIAALVWFVLHSVGLYYDGGEWIPAWEYIWLELSRLVGSLQLGSLIISTLLLIIAATSAWILGRKGIFIRI